MLVDFSGRRDSMYPSISAHHESENKPEYERSSETRQQRLPSIADLDLMRLARTR